MCEMTTRVTSFAVLLFMASLCVAPPVVHSQHTRPLREPIVVKVIRLDHADAEQLASVLSPLLSKDGRMIAYPPTNTLIIRDRQSLVEQLVRVIKGVSDP
jgi:general secretion pathway protein D